MNRMWLFIGGILLLVAVSISAVIWYFSGQPQTTKSITETQKIKEKLLTWDDPAEFTFDYPEGVSIDKHDEDQENYAHLEITNADHQGKIIIWAKDLPLNKKGVAITDANEWVSENSKFSGANSLDTTLGGETAKKIMLEDPKTLIVGTVFDDVLWYVEGDFTSSDYWLNTFETITSSFAFKLKVNEQKTDASQAGSDTTAEPVDEEEIVE